MRIFWTLIIILAAILVIWIDIPKGLPYIHPLSISIGSFKKQFDTKLGLDLKGGSHLVFEADTSKTAKQDLQDALNSARDVIERRVNLYGVSEPVVQTVQAGDKYRIVVDLPGVTNVVEAVQLIGRTAQLDFKEFQIASSEAKTATPSYILKDSGLTGKDVKKSAVVFNQQTGKPEVSLSFSDRGAKLFADITRRNVGNPVGIFIDQSLISNPVVQEPILDGNAVINGNFTLDDANKLAIAINSGALPLPIRLVEQQNIGPTLGAIDIQRSVVAGVVGLAMVMFFMVMYYGRLGIIACLALIIYGLISWAVFRAIPVVLTLPGVTGFILSIGMAVDSNILIFERIKEERRKGRDLDVAIRLGFGRAIDAIKDANITTLLVTFILFNPLNWDFLPQFGLVRGFALTLAIGVATSLFTGVVITRHLIKYFYRHG